MRRMILSLYPASLASFSCVHPILSRFLRMTAPSAIRDSGFVKSNAIIASRQGAPTPEFPKMFRSFSGPSDNLPNCRFLFQAGLKRKLQSGRVGSAFRRIAVYAPWGQLHEGY